MNSVEAMAGRRTGIRPGTRSARSASRSTGPARGAHRQAGWAKTFGLPLELIGPGRPTIGSRSCRSMASSARSSCSPTAGSIRPLAFALAAGARAGADRDWLPGCRDRLGRWPGGGRPGREGWRTADDPDRCRGQCRRDLLARDRPARRGQRPDHPDGPRVPVHRADRGGHRQPAHDARPRPPVLLPGGGRRAVHGRLRAPPGAVVARRRAGRLQRQAPRPGLAALRRDHGRRGPPGPADRRCRDQPDDQRARGVHPGQRVHPGRERGARLLRRSRLLRPRHRRGRRGRPPGGQLDRRRRARARPVEDGHPPVRGAVPLPGVHPCPNGGGLPAVLRHPLSQRGAPECPAAPPLAGLRPPGRARGGLRREIRLGAAELVHRERGRRPGGLAASRLGRRALVAGDRRRGTGDQDYRRPVRRIELRQDRDRRSRCGGVPAAGCAPTTSIARSAAIVYTQMLEPAGRDRDRLHGDEGRRRSLPDRHRHRLRQP